MTETYRFPIGSKPSVELDWMASCYAQELLNQDGAVIAISRADFVNLTGVLRAIAGQCRIVERLADNAPPIPAGENVLSFDRRSQRVQEAALSAGSEPA